MSKPRGEGRGERSGIDTSLVAVAITPPSRGKKSIMSGNIFRLKRVFYELIMEYYGEIFHNVYSNRNRNYFNDMQ